MRRIRGGFKGAPTSAPTSAPRNLHHEPMRVRLDALSVARVTTGYGRRQDRRGVKPDAVSGWGVSVEEPGKSGPTPEGLKGAHIRCMSGRRQSVGGEVACVGCRGIDREGKGKREGRIYICRESGGASVHAPCLMQTDS
ncbi:hypothetical protein VC83_08595 [Pseudogymnoascus destructans]|uniref:Uncharacterized protein n=1 Tax=Pseudogymnoascus destructans TaxID=655981 RepID=A0A177A0G3_9PEZI|nr:uncharacterized protein VC83_08595 [Pseudogymnoascus destructans]OAF54972.1 hypothetical protein VC83_08595 [Pseudogymnoascus destructans]